MIYVLLYLAIGFLVGSLAAIIEDDDWEAMKLAAVSLIFWPIFVVFLLLFAVFGAIRVFGREIVPHNIEKLKKSLKNRS